MDSPFFIVTCFSIYVRAHTDYSLSLDNACPMMDRENSGFKHAMGQCILFLGSSQTLALLQSINDIRLLGIGLELACICKGGS